jgi:hypothetical protein
VVKLNAELLLYKFADAESVLLLRRLPNYEFKIVFQSVEELMKMLPEANKYLELTVHEECVHPGQLLGKHGGLEE